MKDARPLIDAAVASVAPSATLAINELSARLQGEGRAVYRLGLGQSPFPVPAPVVEVLREHAHVKDYLPVRGLPGLREAVAAYHARHGASFGPQDVLIGPGSKELMFQLLLACDADVLLPSPAWVTYAPQTALARRRLRWLPTEARDAYRLAPDALDAACRAAPGRRQLLVLTTPDNPTGTAYPAAHLEALAEVVRRHDVVVLSDEIYAELHFADEHVSLARWAPDHTIVSAGLSKWCGAGGWRLGTFAIPPALGPLRDAMAVIASETYSAVAAPVQHAAVRAYAAADPVLDRYREGQRAICAGVGRAFAGRLRAAGATLPEPEGAFYGFADFGAHREALARRRLTTSDALATALLDEAGVALLPGSAFGRPPEELTARLAWVDFDGAAALAAWEARGGGPVDTAFLEIWCPRVLEAAASIAAWLP